MLVAAARKSNRICQMGNQRRSWSKIQEAIGLLKGGGIGPRPFRALLVRQRAPADRRRQAGAGAGVARTGTCWQGPAPRVDYRDNVVHYNWHWFWHWSTGEAGNNGVHPLDMARWAIGDDYPTRVTSAGGRYYADDDWQPPDTQMISFEFPSRVLVTWEGMSCNPVGDYGEGVGALFQGEEGLPARASRQRLHALRREGKEVRTETASDGTGEHHDRRPGPRQRHHPYPEFPRSGPRPAETDLGDRGRPQEHDARPPGEHRPADGPRAQLRSQDRAGSWATTTR